MPTEIRIRRSRRPGRQRWWWSAHSADGELLAVSGERYANRLHAVEQARLFARHLGCRLIDPYDLDGKRA